MASAHMEMRQPYAFRSQYNPNESNKDYVNIAPLAADGSNYPCKNYHLTSSQTVNADYTAGSQYNMQIYANDPHRGGSCQISLSYDNGETFRVIKSIIGGCPCANGVQCENHVDGSSRTIPFTIPADAPSKSRALLAWSWFNNEGNREMYMNCAPVKIQGTTNQGLGGLPSIFRANIVGPQCKLQHWTDVVFPNPGNDVFYGGQYSSSNPPPATQLEGCPDSGNLGPVFGDGVVSSSSSTFSTRTSSSSTRASTTSTRASTTSTTSTRASTTSTRASTTSTRASTTSTRTTSSTSTRSASPSPGTVCTPNQKICETSDKRRKCKSDGSGFEIQAAPANTTCQSSSGNFVDASGNVVEPPTNVPGANCPEGQAICETSSKRRVCKNGNFVIENAPSGKTCSNGVFV